MKKLTAFLLTIAIHDAFAAGETITDGTVGNVQNLGSGSFTVPQSLGATVGHNLFHSFSEFNVNTQQTATFTGDNNLQNVISRVTGGKLSSIDGTIKSEVGKADFYFINPAGVVFGQNASLDVPAAFHLSTADYLQFRDATVFSAITPNGSELSSVDPTQFGFLGASAKNNGLIAIHGARLSVQPDQALDLVAGKIEISSTATQNAQLHAESGAIRLVAMQRDGKVMTDAVLLPPVAPTEQNAGDIIVDGRTDSDALPPIQLKTTGNGGGNFSLWGNKAHFLKANAESNNSGITNPLHEEIAINTHHLILDNSKIAFNADNGLGPPKKPSNPGNPINPSDPGNLGNPGNPGNPGNVGLHTKIAETTPPLSTNAENITGDAGNIHVESTKLDILNKGQIASETFSNGNAGVITVKTNDLNIEGQLSAISSDAKDGSRGNAGTVYVTADYLKIDAHQQGASEGGKPTPAGIISSTFGSGNAGTVSIKAKTVDVLNGGIISSKTSANGKAGMVYVDTEHLKIAGQGTGISSDSLPKKDAIIESGGYDSQDVGVQVHAKTLAILEGGKISSETYTNDAAGTVSIETATLNIEGLHSAISSDTRGGGKAGTVKVSADKVNIDAQAKGEEPGQVAGILSSTFGRGDAGTIEFNANTLALSNGGIISSKTAASGNAGTVTVTVSETLSIDGKGAGISSNAIHNNEPSLAKTHVGKAGYVNIQAKRLAISNGGLISTETQATGDAGTVDVRAKDLYIVGFGGISSNTSGSGKAGKVTVETDNATLDGQGAVISSASNTKASSGKTGDVSVSATHAIHIYNGGSINAKNEAEAHVDDATDTTANNVTIKAPEITLQNQGEISTHSSGNIAASSITIDATKSLSLDGAEITTTAASGNGGAITLNSNNALTRLKNSGFMTTVENSNGNGGDITLNSDILVMETGVIQANARSGNGGAINLNVNALIPSGNRLIKGGLQQRWQAGEFGFNLIQAASATGLSGVINSSAPQLNLSGVLANFGKPQFESKLIEQDECDENEGSSLTRVGNGGLPRKRSEL